MLAVALPTAVLVTLAALREAERQPRNVVLITVDTLRADRLSAYGYQGARTGAIDRLAREGVIFSRSYCDMPWTTGSMASVMTGKYGPGHGVLFPWQRLSNENVTLAEELASAGFDTGAVVGSFPVAAVYGLNQGFAHYDDHFTTPFYLGSNNAEGVSEVEPVEVLLSGSVEELRETFDRKMHGDAFRPDLDVSAQAVRWLEQRGEERFFLWVHFFGPHERIYTDRGRQRQRIVDDYDWDLFRSDEAVRRVLDKLDKLGLSERTLTVFHSDHGQSLAEHGLIGHGRDLFEPSMRIPFILRHEGSIKKGGRVDTIVRNIDIAPTVLDYMGLDIPASMQGRSLRGVIEGGPDVDHPAFMEVALTPAVPVRGPGGEEIFGTTGVVGATMGGLKYVRTRFAGSCVKDSPDYSMGKFGINPILPLGGTPIPAEECEGYVFEALYETAAGEDHLFAAEIDDVSASYPEELARLRDFTDSVIASRTGAEEFELSEEEESKLKSLGYLE